MAGSVVDGVVVPGRLAVVDVEDEESVAGNACVPFGLASVFEQEVFVVVAVVVDDIGLASLLQRLHGGDLNGLLVELDGCFPACHPSLVGGVACGPIAVAIVGADVHEVPHVHATSAAVACVVEIREAEAVAELVAHGSDAADGVVAVELASAGIGVDAHAVEGLCARSVAVIGS